MPPGNSTVDIATVDNSGSTSSGLLERVKAGESEAWRHLAELYGPMVLGWCQQSGLQTSDAADVMQEVFAAVLANVGDFRRDRSGDSFRGWLWTITRNRLRDHLRRRVSRPQAFGGTDAAEQFQQLPEALSEATDSGDQGGLIHRALDLIRPEFEDRTWEAFWRTTTGGHSTPGVGADLGLTPGAVRQAKYRILKRLRAQLDDLEKNV
jgi:RNA polymerase sigma-70 factor (ECF subfamily)